MSLYYFLTNQTTGKTKANKVQAKTVHFSQNPNVNHRNQLNKQGERVQKGKRQHCLGSKEIVRDKMGKWVMFLYAHRHRQVQTKEIAPPYTSKRSVLSTGASLDEAREVEKFLGFGLCFGRVTGLKGEGKMRKEKADGDEMGFHR